MFVASHVLQVTVADTVKIADFGMAKLTSDGHGADRKVPVAWTAPEVLCNEPHNSKSDVYSYGVVLWEVG